MNLLFCSVVFPAGPAIDLQDRQLLDQTLIFTVGLGFGVGQLSAQTIFSVKNQKPIGKGIPPLKVAVNY